MKKFLVVLAILFTGILLAGCTSQPATPVATPTATPVMTPVMTTVLPTPVPTTAAPVLNVTAAPTATPTPAPTPVPSVTITFGQAGTIIPGTSVTIKAGSNVVFVNNDPFKPHGIQATAFQSGKYFGSMNALLIPYGTPLTVTFPVAGSFGYTTTFQPLMQGVITVTK
ncbi:MAG: hypothetical protein ABSB80_09245 [Methanoregula sp.]|jgi:plastocyanin|uniref:cupredoxin domain-containing protein n=1 Tax=Methanoregula sp. TaxID=2052170 RepID=UPI003D0D4E3B